MGPSGLVDPIAPRGVDELPGNAALVDGTIGADAEKCYYSYIKTEELTSVSCFHLCKCFPCTCQF